MLRERVSSCMKQWLTRASPMVRIANIADRIVGQREATPTSEALRHRQTCRGCREAVPRAKLQPSLERELGYRANSKAAASHTYSGGSFGGRPEPTAQTQTKLSVRAGQPPAQLRSCHRGNRTDENENSTRTRFGPHPATVCYRRGSGRRPSYLRYRPSSTLLDQEVKL